MSTHKIQSSYSTGHLTWVLPHPAIRPLTLGAGAEQCSYALRNASQAPVVIQNVELAPGGDPRLRIAGGTCLRGVRLSPNASATIILEVNPRSIGVVKQVLRVLHNGFGPPLWLEIEMTIVDIPARQRAGARSYLVDETRTMERQRRLHEQEGHRRLARVHAREHGNEDAPQQALEGELQNSILQNPWLDSQRFDGVDPNLNPEPPLNTEARREFDNERREQEMEKQLRLGNMPKFSTAPKPHEP